ncbi:MAG: ParB N-terminal domain-containing protein [Pseudomonadota bacterium]
MILQHLNISQFNIADDSYRITFAPNLDELKRSIRTVGLVQPVVVRHTPEGTYQIVAGYKRVLVCQDLGRQSIPALVNEPADMSPTQAFLTNLHDNAVSRQLNLIERSTAVAKLKQFYSMPEEESVKQFLPLIGEEPSYKILHELIGLSQLTEPMKHHVVQKNLALSSAARIAEFTASTQQALLAVLTHIRPSTNKLNELLALLREISARDALSVEAILQRYQLLQVVANPNASSTDKVSALRQALRGVRLPQLSERQKQLASLIEALELPDKAKLHVDPYFESQNMKLEYNFKEPKQLTALITQITKAFEKQQWQKIFDWYQL